LLLSLRVKDARMKPAYLGIVEHVERTPHALEDVLDLKDRFGGVCLCRTC